MLLILRLCFFLSLFLLLGCARDTHHHIVVSIHDEKMVVFTDAHPVAHYPVSTSKYGTGDAVGSYKTPLGRFVICQKIGTGAPSGMVFKDAKATGEILAPNAPGRDPSVTRIFWLEGKDSSNRNARKRCIYIHGTPQERSLGCRKSYGCIRMSSRDALALDALVGRGTSVEIIEGALPSHAFLN